MSQRKFAIVTGASSGIGLELAKLAAADGYDLLVADTVNHRLRGVKVGQDRLLRSRTATEVSSVAGSGAQWMQGEPLPRGEGDART